MSEYINTSTLIHALRCHKAYWFHTQEQRTERDGLFGYYQQIRQKTHEKAGGLFSKAEKLGKEALPHPKPGETKTFEKVQWEGNGIGLVVDFLIIDEKRVQAYVVKRSLSVKLKHQIEADMAYLIAEKKEISEFHFHVMYLNKRHTPVNDQALFKTRRISPNHERISKIKRFLDNKPEKERMPQVQIGEQCYEKGLCPFYKNCFDKTRKSIFDLRYLSAGEAVNLYQSGIQSISQVPEEYELNYFQRKQTETVIKNKSYMAKGKLDAFLNAAYFPIIFMDFEGYQTVLPQRATEHPMQTIPFLFSMHYWESPNTSPISIVHINDRSSTRPEKEFCEALIKYSKKGNSFVVFNQMFELDIINKLIHLEPVHKEELERIKSGILDFQTLFERPYYYHPEQDGTINLKAITKAIIKEDVYERSWIKNGLEACKYYDYLAIIDSEAERENILEGLKNYCIADTLSMYLIWKELQCQLDI